MKKIILLFLCCFVFSVTVFSQTYKSGDAVQIEWKGRYYPGKIMEVKNNKFYISYDGYDKEWYEWVSAERLKTASAVTEKVATTTVTTETNKAATTALPSMTGVESIYDLEMSKSKTKLLAASAYGKIYVLEPKTFEVKKELKVSETPLAGATISFDEKYIATLDSDGQVKVYNTEDYSLFWEIKDFSGGTSIRFLPAENKLLICASPKVDYTINDLYLYDLEKKTLIKKFFTSPMSTKCVSDMVFNQDGSIMATGLSNKEHSIEIWDMKTLTLIKKIPTTHDVSALSFSKDGKYLASGGIDKKVTLWETTGYTKKWQSDYSGDSYVYVVHIDDASQQVFVSGMAYGVTFKSYDLATGKIVKNIGDSNAGCNTMVMNMDGDGLIGGFSTHGDFPKYQWMVKMFKF